MALKLNNLNVKTMIAFFLHPVYGECKLEFIETESEDTGRFYIEPYMVIYKNYKDGQDMHIELLDTDIQFTNLYEILNCLIKSKVKS